MRTKLKDALDLLERHVWDHQTGEVIEDTEAFLRKHGLSPDDEGSEVFDVELSEALERLKRNREARGERPEEMVCKPRLEAK